MFHIPVEIILGKSINEALIRQKSVFFIGLQRPCKVLHWGQNLSKSSKGGIPPTSTPTFARIKSQESSI